MAELITVPKDIKFEFHKNKYFFSKILGEDMKLLKPQILIEGRCKLVPAGKYIVINIGASSSKRRWAWQNFVELIKLLNSSYSLPIVLCGGPGDITNGKHIESEVGGNVFNVVGKTSLHELLLVLRKAELLISNETGAAHMAVALNVKKIFVISNGNHYKRFTPYPESIFKNYYSIFHPDVFDSYRKSEKVFEIESTLDINQIQYKDAWSKTTKLRFTESRRRNLSLIEDSFAITAFFYICSTFRSPKSN